MAVVVPPPPARATPASFYLDYLPKVWSAMFPALAPPPLWHLELELIVAGEAFTITLDHGTCRAAAGPASTPLCSVRSDLAAWRAVSLDLWPRLLKSLTVRLPAIQAKLTSFMTTADVGARLDRLDLLPGTLDLEITDDAGDAARFAVEIASGAGPTAGLSLQEPELWALIRGEVTLARLLKSRTAVRGDAGYLLRLAALLGLNA
ncbi:MAG: hypothetical protein HY903_13850 [Deltaproteobacteria bacterium]|nr:hypothetical protein [Deltaproteobacteria bacterium]